MYEQITYAVDEPVATITLNRPEALNALTARMMAEIRHALAEAEKDERVVGIVLTGAGRGFCAGMDMNALNSLSSGEGGGPEDLSHLDARPGDPEMGDNFEVTYSYLLSLRKPLIAAVNGAAAGLGMVFALLSDMRFMADNAKFVTAFAQRGLIAEHGISWILPRLVGPSRALDLLWSSRGVGAEEAFRIGLADRVCPAGEAASAAADYIREIAAKSAPISLRVMKAQVYRHLNMELGPAMKDTNQLMAESLERDDFREGVRSFIEKRPPNFKRVSV